MENPEMMTPVSGMSLYHLEDDLKQALFSYLINPLSLHWIQLV